MNCARFECFSHMYAMCSMFCVQTQEIELQSPLSGVGTVVSGEASESDEEIDHISPNVRSSAYGTVSQLGILTISTSTGLSICSIVSHNSERFECA